MNPPLLPTLDELLHPSRQPDAIRQAALAATDPLDPIQLFNMTWRRPDGDVEHRVLPPALTGVDAPIVVLSGRCFPTGSHKVGPAYSCAREALLSGAIRPDGSTLVFPSTGNYGIGGAWVGPRLGFDSLVVLPEEMSAERFEKIRGYGAQIVATPGSESNVKEIYDKVAELREDPNNFILNQFADMGNYRFHYHCTGGAMLGLARDRALAGIGSGRIAAFVSAMGSGGTIAAGERIRTEQPDVQIVAVEPMQCPTLFNVGFGAHAIEGIGDKHVTWIHNVRATDLLVCIDDRSCLRGLQLLEEGQATLRDHLGLDADWLASIAGVFGISGVCNILASIQAIRHLGLGPDDPVYTVATDGFDRYPSVMRRLDEEEGLQTDTVARQRIEIFREQMPVMVLDGTDAVRRRWHNQKYFTWVEQQGQTVDALEALWSTDFWAEQAARIPDLDRQTLGRR